MDRLKNMQAMQSIEGTIYENDEIIAPEPPLHRNCRCVIERLQALLAGTATNNGLNGADWWLKEYGRLPEYYISEENAIKLGWKPKQGNLASVAPKSMLLGGIHQNKNVHLPAAPGRIWYEADINYTTGRRNWHRILFSNDGLIFVTYNHYETFFEII